MLRVQQSVAIQSIGQVPTMIEAPSHEVERLVLEERVRRQQAQLQAGEDTSAMQQVVLLEQQQQRSQ
eukprot:1915683-Prorocentrum_lima.AAC.1